MIEFYLRLAALFHHHSLIMIIAILAVAFTIGLKTIKMLLVQVGLLFILMGCYLIDGEGIISFLAATVQAAFFLFLLFKIKKAIDYEYTLVIEKTHEIPREITKGGNLGTKKTFF